MTLSREELTYGYWPSRQLGGKIPSPISLPDRYDGSDTLNLACTQTSLTRTEQSSLIKSWCNLLPDLRLKTLVFSSKVNQELFEAASKIKGLEALSIKWSSIKSIDAITNLKSLNALFIGSSPSLTGLNAISNLSGLHHLFIEHIDEAQDLSFVSPLKLLREFGISASRGRTQEIASLTPLSNLEHLEMLWLVSVRIKSGGLMPLYNLKNLASLRTTFKKSSPAMIDLCSAVPTLKYFQPVG